MELVFPKDCSYIRNIKDAFWHITPAEKKLLLIYFFSSGNTVVDMVIQGMENLITYSKLLSTKTFSTQIWKLSNFFQFFKIKGPQRVQNQVREIQSFLTARRRGSKNVFVTLFQLFHIMKLLTLSCKI